MCQTTSRMANLFQIIHRTIHVQHLEFDIVNQKLVIYQDRPRWQFPFNKMIGIRFKDKKKQIKLAMRTSLSPATIHRPQILFVMKLKFKKRISYDDFFDLFEEYKLFKLMGNCYSSKNKELVFLSPMFRCYLPNF